MNVRPAKLSRRRRMVQGRSRAITATAAAIAPATRPRLSTTAGSTCASLGENSAASAANPAQVLGSVRRCIESPFDLVEAVLQRRDRRGNPTTPERDHPELDGAGGDQGQPEAGHERA